jgi:heme-degrading monooxygenase HmoA
MLAHVEVTSVTDCRGVQDSNEPLFLRFPRTKVLPPAIFRHSPHAHPFDHSLGMPASMRYHTHRIGLDMFVVVWQFEIAEDKIAGFEAAYGPEGAWAKLFRTSPSYLGTELLHDAYIPGSYLTIDRWASEADFRAFRKQHDQDYEVLDRACDSLTSRETRIGAYTV